MRKDPKKFKKYSEKINSLSLNSDYPKVESYESVSFFLRDVRKYLYRSLGSDFTQASVGAACGFRASQYISNIERGLHVPSLKTASLMLDFYNIDRKDIYKLFMTFREKQYREHFLNSPRRSKA